MIVRFRGELWEHGGDASWYFVSLPQDDSDDVREQAGRGRRGFGSVRVHATIGASSWRTSVFPSKEGPYLLPVKKQVRRAEQVDAGDVVDVVLEIDEG